MPFFFFFLVQMYITNTKKHHNPITEHSSRSQHVTAQLVFQCFMHLIWKYISRCICSSCGVRLSSHWSQGGNKAEKQSYYHIALHHSTFLTCAHLFPLNKNLVRLDSGMFFLLHTLVFLPSSQPPHFQRFVAGGNVIMMVMKRPLREEGLQVVELEERIKSILCRRCCLESPPSYIMLFLPSITNMSVYSTLSQL